MLPACAGAEAIALMLAVIEAPINSFFKMFFIFKSRLVLELCFIHLALFKFGWLGILEISLFQSVIGIFAMCARDFQLKKISHEFRVR